MLTRRGFLAGTLGLLGVSGCGTLENFLINLGKKNIILSHGFLQSIEELRDYFNFFREKNLGAVLWEYPAKNSIDELADCLGEILNLHGIQKPILFGVSMGGMVSMRYAEKNPDNYSGLVIIASADKARADNPFGTGEIFNGAEKEMYEDILRFDIDSKKLEKPMLHVYGEQDEFFAREDVETFLNGYGGDYRRLTFRDGKHNILNERGNEIRSFVYSNLGVFG